MENSADQRNHLSKKIWVFQTTWHNISRCN